MNSEGYLNTFEFRHIFVTFVVVHPTGCTVVKGLFKLNRGCNEQIRKTMNYT